MKMQRTIIVIVTLSFLLCCSEILNAGSIMPITVYQLKYNPDSIHKIEIVPENIYADIGEYRFGYGTFAKRFKAVQQGNKYSFKYIQENVAYINGLEVKIEPWININQLDVYLNFSNCKEELERLKNEKGIKIADLIDGIGAALTYTYRNQDISNEKVNNVILHIVGISKENDKVKKYEYENIVKQWLIAK